MNEWLFHGWTQYSCRNTKMMTDEMNREARILESGLTSNHWTKPGLRPKKNGLIGVTLLFFEGR